VSGISGARQGGVPVAAQEAAAGAEMAAIDAPTTEDGGKNPETRLPADICGKSFFGGDSSCMQIREIWNSFRQYPRQFWLMTVGVAISTAGGGMIWPFLLIYATERLGMPLSVVAPLLSINAGTGIFSSFVAGTLADRVGRKTVMIISLTVNGFAFMALMNASTFMQFVIMMIVIGFSNPLYQVGADAMLADIIEPERRTSAYSINRVAVNAGFALGPAIGGFLAAASYRYAFYAAGAAFLTYSIMLTALAHETLAQPARRRMQASGPATGQAGYRHVFRDAPYLRFMALMALGLIAPMMLWTLMPLYAKTNFGISERVYGWIPTTNALMCVFIQYGVTRMTRSYRSLPIVAMGMLVYAIGAGSVALMSSFAGFWLSMVVLTFGELMVVPTATKYVADLAPATSRGRYMGVYWLSWGFARALAPLIGATLNDQLNPRAIWLGALALGLASAMGLTWLARSKAADWAIRSEA
jgi:MFS family permease